MNPNQGLRWLTRPADCQGERLTQRALLVLLLGLISASGLIAWGGPIAAAPPGDSLHAPWATAGSTPLVRSAAGGDLVVGNGVTWTIAPPSGHLTYYQGGNIVVQAGGTLVVRNTTIVVTQSVGSTGSVANRLAHVYSLLDQGTIVLLNSSITTLVEQLDPYPAFAMTINDGALRMTNGSLDFPGAITVEGPTASFWLSHASIGPNPSVSAVLGPLAGKDRALSAVLNSTRYGPSLVVEGGARATLLDSSESATFQQKILGNAVVPGPTGTNGTSVVLTGGSGLTSTIGLVGPDPSNSTRLALAALLPTAFTGSLEVNATANAPTTISSWSVFDGASSYPLPATNLGGGGNTVRVPIPSGLLAQLNQSGMPAFVEALDTPNQVGVRVTAPATNVVTITNALAAFVPWSYNLTVTGTRSNLTIANTELGINYGPEPGETGYTPWNATKLDVNAGSEAFLANISVNASLPATYTNHSLVLVRGTSNASLYRWLVVPVRAPRGVPIYGAVATPSYAVPSASASLNATANWQNSLTTTDPDLANYLTTLDRALGASSYGASNASGNSTLLVASGLLDAASEPSGWFDGVYAVRVQTPAGATVVSASVPPYPYEMQASGPNSTGPTIAPTAFFANFKTGLSTSTPGISVAAQLVTNRTIAEGENISVLETVNNTGSGTISSFSVGVTFELAGATVLTRIGPNQTFGPLIPGASATARFNWTVNESLIGIHPNGILATFNATVAWKPGAGSSWNSTSVTVVPPYISFSLTGATQTVTPGGAFDAVAHVAYVGVGAAVLNVSAIGPSGSFLLVTGRSVAQGSTGFTLETPTTLPSGTYTLHATVAFEGRTVATNLTGALIVPGPSSTSSTPWYDQSILGVPLWLILVIVAAIAAGLAGFLLWTRQRAKGKVVECGECGAMIPENATVCPKCGAEFEVDRVRCSRCGSTIPGGAQVCPECAATLLGKESEEKADPERQGYADFVERFRAEGKKSLGDSYSESAFWDWWKRQPSFVPFNQWKSQQAQTSRAGMTAPREGVRGGGPGGPRPPSTGPGARGGPTASTRPAASAPSPSPVTETEPEAPAPAGEGMAPMTTCANCKKEIPSGYLVCPFCGAVTQ